MKKYKDKLHSIELRISEKTGCCIIFSFLYFRESVNQLQQDEGTVKEICSKLLPDVYTIMKILCNYKTPEAHNDQFPKITYESTLTKPKKRYFKAAYSLDDVKSDGKPLKLLSMLLRLKNVEEDRNAITFGRFDITFQHFRWDRNGGLKTAFNKTISKHVDSRLLHLARPLKNLIDYLVEKVSLEIMLSNGWLQEENLDEDQEEAFIVLGLITQFPDNATQLERDSVTNQYIVNDISWLILQ